VTNPAIGAALLAALGAVYGVGEALAPGLFDAIAIPLIVKQIVSAVNDKIDNGLDQTYGLCGGMTFAPLDYYYQQWVIPKGIFTRELPNTTPPPADIVLTVPPGDNPNAAVLRNYINQRFKDTWSSGGVRDKMVQWFVLLQTIPAQFGGGGPEVQRRCEPEWPALAALLHQGKPQPIALLFDTWDIFSEHQVVAYGYGGDPNTGSAFINIYDNNHPNQELLIRFDFSQAEMQGQITNVAGDVVLDGKGNPYYPALKGFFLATYTPQVPPPSWAVQQGMIVLPSDCQCVHQPFNLAATVTNAFTFFEQSGQQTALTVVASDPWLMHVVPDDYAQRNGIDVSSAASTDYADTERFDTAGDFIVMAKAFVRVIKDGAIVKDQFGAPLAWMVNLPALTPAAHASVKVHVMPLLRIEPVNRSGSACYYPYVEGGEVTLRIQSLPFSGLNLQYHWQVAGASPAMTDAAQCALSGLPASGSTVSVSVEVINPDSGCIAIGHLTVRTYSASQASTLTSFCQLMHRMQQMIRPGIINPLGPDDPEMTQFIRERLPQVRRDAAQILKLADALGAPHSLT